MGKLDLLAWKFGCCSGGIIMNNWVLLHNGWWFMLHNLCVNKQHIIGFLCIWWFSYPKGCGLQECTLSVVVCQRGIKNCSSWSVTHQIHFAVRVPIPCGHQLMNGRYRCHIPHGPENVTKMSMTHEEKYPEHWPSPRPLSSLTPYFATVLVCTT